MCAFPSAPPPTWHVAEGLWIGRWGARAFQLAKDLKPSDSSRCWGRVVSVVHTAAIHLHYLRGPSISRRLFLRHGKLNNLPALVPRNQGCRLSESFWYVIFNHFAIAVTFLNSACSGVDRIA